MSYNINYIKGFKERNEPYPSLFQKALNNLDSIASNRGVYPIVVKELFNQLELDITEKEIVPQVKTFFETDKKTEILTEETILTLTALLEQIGLTLIPISIPCNLKLDQQVYVVPKPLIAKDTDIAIVRELTKTKPATYTKAQLQAIQNATEKMLNYNVLCRVFEGLSVLNITSLDATQRAALSKEIESREVPHDAKRYILALYTYASDFGLADYNYNNPRMVLKPLVKDQQEIVVETIASIVCSSTSMKEPQIKKDYPFARMMEQALAEESKKPHNIVQKLKFLAEDEFTERLERKALSRLTKFKRKDALDMDFGLLMSRIKRLSRREISQVLRHKIRISPNFQRKVIANTLKFDSNLQDYFAILDRIFNLNYQILLAVPNFSASTLKVYTKDTGNNKIESNLLYNPVLSNEIMCLGEFKLNLLPKKDIRLDYLSQNKEEIQTTNSENLEADRISLYKQQFQQMILKQEQKNNAKTASSTILVRKANQALKRYVVQRIIENDNTGIGWDKPDSVYKKIQEELLRKNELYSTDIASSFNSVNPYIFSTKPIFAFDGIHYHKREYPVSDFHVLSYTWEIATHLYHEYLCFCTDSDNLIPNKDFEYIIDLKDFLVNPLADLKRLNKINMYEFVMRQIFSDPNQREHLKLFELETNNYEILKRVNPLPLLFYHSLFIFDKYLENPSSHFNNELFYITLLLKEKYAINFYLQRIVNKYGLKLINIPKQFFTLIALNRLLFPKQGKNSKVIQYTLKAFSSKNSKNNLYKVLVLKDMANQLYNQVHTKYPEMQLQLTYSDIGLKKLKK